MAKNTSVNLDGVIKKRFFFRDLERFLKIFCFTRTVKERGDKINLTCVLRSPVDKKKLWSLNFRRDSKDFFFLKEWRVNLNKLSDPQTKLFKKYSIKKPLSPQSYTRSTNQLSFNWEFKRKCSKRKKGRKVGNRESTMTAQREKNSRDRREKEKRRSRKEGRKQAGVTRSKELGERKKKRKWGQPR